MTSPLIIAVPSKGRIQEECNAFFARAGIAIIKANARDYTGRLSGIAHAEVLFLSAGEIPAALESGQAHLGVTGADVIRERIANPDATVSPIIDLGFGRADLVVAVPRAWIDVSTMADLEEVAGAMRARHHRHLRVATKYIRMTREFFSNHGITDYRIVESAGATEGAPASGQADIIVDITTTGATLAANNLKILGDGVILKSQAQLVASRKAEWNDDTKRVLVNIFAQIDANEMARSTTVLQFFYAGDIAALHASMKETLPQAELQAGVSGTEQTLYCDDRDLYPALTLLRKMGVLGKIRTIRADKIFVENNSLVAGFARSIGGF